MTETSDRRSQIHELVNPDGVTEVDIAVCIPSYQEAEHIALPTRKAAAGLCNFYPQLRSVIINCDNHSGDGTAEAFFNAECVIPRVYVSTPPGVRGKGANLRNAFQTAKNFSAKVVVLVDANLLSIKTTWFPGLIDPILGNRADYVAPLYVRHRYDAPISRGLVYPLGQAVFGRRVLQPICVDHAFSAALNDFYLTQDWEFDDRGYRSDLKMLTSAIMNKARICQSFMGHPRLASVTKLDNDLARAFTHVTKAIFDLIITTHDYWATAKTSRGTIMEGVDQPPVKPAPQIELDRRYLYESFRELGRQHRETWRRFFPADLAGALEEELAVTGRGGGPTVTVEQWRQCVVEAVLTYKTASDDDRQAIAAALAPLFFARSLTLNRGAEGLTDRQYNALMEDEARHFESVKRELAERWD